MSDSIPGEWLGDKLSPDGNIEDVAAMASVGFSREAWQELVESLSPADEVWTFCSPWDSWQNHAGRAGVVCLRDGKVLKTITTLMN